MTKNSYYRYSGKRRYQKKKKKNKKQTLYQKLQRLVRALLMGMQISEVAIENSAEIYLIKLEIELPYNPAIPLYSIYSKDISMLCQKDT